MNLCISSVNHLFHTEMINRKFNRSTGDGEEKQNVVLRRDVSMISQKGKTMSAVERLMKQKNFIKECKDSLLGQMQEKEKSGYSSVDMRKKIEEYEKQLDSLDEQIAKEMAKGGDDAEKSGENDLYKKNQPVTKQELENKRMADITKLSAGLKQSEVMVSVQNRMEGEKSVLKAELKSGDSERKRQRIAEIDNRTEELAKENLKNVGKLADNMKDDLEISPAELRQEGLDHLQYQFENGTQAQISDEKIILKKSEDDAVYNHIIENSDIEFNQPSIETQLGCANNDYRNKAYEQGKAPEVNIYDHIVNIHVDSLMKAYQDVYNDIVTGYANGTREVWTQNFEEGADYIEFELEGKSYRFHKLTMEEELARLDRAYEKEAKKAADRAKLMIDTQKIIEKVMPEYEAKMREIEAQRARREGFEVGESMKMLLERIKDKVTPSEGTLKEFNIYEMLMKARTSWLQQFTETDENR